MTTELPTANERVLARAVFSLLDVVEELSLGLAAGQTPGQDWAQLVADNAELHRRELRTGEVSPEDALR